MTRRTPDAQLLASMWRAAIALQTRAAKYSAKADYSGEELAGFARSVSDSMADHLAPAEQALERIEAEREVDPKARRVNMPTETESPE